MNYKDTKFYIILIHSENYIEVAEYPLIRQPTEYNINGLDNTISHINLTNFNTLSNYINCIISKNKKNYFIYSSINECEQFLVHNTNIIPVYCIIGDYITKNIIKYRIINKNIKILK